MQRISLYRYVPLLSRMYIFIVADMSRAAGNTKKSERCGYCPLSWSSDNSKKCFDTGALFSDLLLAVKAGEVEQAISIANNISAVSVISGTESDVEPHWTDN